MKTHRMILFAVLLMVVGRTMADNLRVETVNMSAGGTKQIAVVLNNPTHQYTAFQLDLALPDGVSIAKNNNGKFIVDLAEDRKDDHTLNVSEIGTNTYRFLAFSMTNTEFYGTDGALFYITLQASNDICGGNKTATIQSQVFTEVSGEQYKWNNETFQILIEEVTVTAKSYTREYGDANPVFEFTSEGADLEGSPEIICEATATSPVGEYPIIIKKGSVTNYNDTYVNGTLTITKAPLTIKAGTYTKKQGEVNPEFTLGYDGFKNNETNIVLTKQPIVRCDAVDSSAPGEYAVTVTGAEALNYNINYTNGKLIVVNADALVVVAKSYTREYGDANPTFEFTSEGAAIEGSPEITCEATATSPVGTYPIIIKKGSVTNYNDTYVNGTLTITKAPLTIKAGTYTKKQGEVNPEFTLSYVGFKNNETSEVLTKQSIVSCDAVDSSAPGEYAVTVTGAEALNYDINYTNGKLIVVNADALVVTANSYTRKYGDANPKFEFTSEGATLNGTPEIICEATTASPVGTYPIIIKKGSVTNYNDTYVNGTLTITKAPLAVSVGNYSKKQGEANPEFVITYEGFKNNETSDVLSKEPSVATTATVSSAPGDYDIVVSGGEATNYDITYTNGKLTITNADPVTITAKSYTREYGDANPKFEFTSEGATLNGTPEITCEATTTSPVGTYPIVIRKGSVTNYNDTYVNGTLTITKAPLTIKAGTYTKKQGAANPKFILSYEGFKNNETQEVLTKQPTAICEATGSSAPGEYAVTITGAEALNYDISYTDGKLIVVNADALVVVAKSYTREYGDANPTFEFTSEGATLNGTPEITCEATTTSPVGTYPIIIKKGSVTNYNDTYVNGTLTITKVPLAVSIGNYTKKQGEDNPEFVITYEGFKNNETSDVLSKKPSVATTATVSSAPGDYDIVVSGGEATNYDITYKNGKLTITNADPVTITAKSYTREYGDANPKFEFTSEGAAIEGSPEIICEATATSPVGEYPIIIKKGSVTNYNDTYVNGTLTITKAPLTIKAGTYTKKQGAANPEFILSYEGFKNNETQEVLTKQPTVICEATGSSAPGEYAVTITGAEALNYDINYTNGKLIVVNADALVVVAKSYTREYGDANPTFEYTTEGATMDGTPEIICEATAASPVGEYPIIIKKGSVTNYNDTYVNGVLTITKAPLTITAKDYTIKWGDELPVFEAVYEGLKNNETPQVALTSFSISCGATSMSDEGTYDIVVTATSGNYELTLVQGTLTITEPDSHTLLYMVDGEVYKSYSVKYGSAITPESEPTKEGYTFSGWSEIPATMPNQDVTVTGSFTINKYTLTYMVDGEVYKTYEVEYGSEIVPEAAPEKEGYTFSGWSEIPEIMPANDVVVTGTFTINKYTLTYMVDGEVYKTYEVEYGSEIEPEAAPEKEGYSFSGWSKIPETMPANDVVVTGTFTWVDAIPGIITYQCEYQIFTPDGRLVNKLQKGLNIIRLSNGLMKKLMVK